MAKQRSSPGPVRSLLVGIGLPVVLAALTACYSFQPAVGGGVEPTEDVRVRLSHEQALELSEMTGRELRSLRGRVLRAEEDSVTLDVGWGGVYAGTVFEGRRDTLSFHRRDLVEIDRREFSWVRTALVAGGVGVALGILVGQIAGGGGGNGSGNGNTF